MEENKSKKSGGVPLVLVIAILVIVLAGCIMYVIKNNEQKLAENNNNSEQTINELKDEISTLKNQISEKEKNQYEKIKGTYTYTTENYPGHENVYIEYSLNLKDDGTFNYIITVDNHGGFCGNYIINGSEVILNKLFSYGSDAALSVVNGQVKLKINENGTISDNNKHRESPITNVVLIKETTEIKENTLKEHIEMAAKDDAIDVFEENK